MGIPGNSFIPQTVLEIVAVRTLVPEKPVFQLLLYSFLFLRNYLQKPAFSMRLLSCLFISQHQFRIDRPFGLCAGTPQVAGSWFLISTPCPFFQWWAPFSRCRRITTLLPQEVETSLGVTGFGLLPCSSCHNEPTCASGRTLIPTFLFTELFLSPIFLTYLIFLIFYHLNSSVNREKRKL